MWESGTRVTGKRGRGSCRQIREEGRGGRLDAIATDDTTLAETQTEPKKQRLFREEKRGHFRALWGAFLGALRGVLGH
eukprot:1771949-Rhodomonas_salina.1